MKSLKPSAREKKRYLLVRTQQVHPDSSKRGQTKGENLKTNVENAILDFIGVLGMSKCGLSWIKNDKNSVVICINREMVDSVRASLCVWPDKMSVEKVSGTLRGLGK